MYGLRDRAEPTQERKEMTKAVALDEVLALTEQAPDGKQGFYCWDCYEQCSLSLRFVFSCECTCVSAGT